jgi:hypothetical protein
MTCVDYRAAKAIVDSRLAEVQRWNETDSLLRGLKVKGQGQSVLYRLGQQMVAWGKRLERYDLPQPSH